MAKPTTVKIKLVSSADTGFFYVTKKNPRNITEKMSFRKYDPSRASTSSSRKPRSSDVAGGLVPVRFIASALGRFGSGLAFRRGRFLRFGGIRPRSLGRRPFARAAAASSRARTASTNFSTEIGLET